MLSKTMNNQYIRNTQKIIVIIIIIVFSLKPPPYSVRDNYYFNSTNKGICAQRVKQLLKIKQSQNDRANFKNESSNSKIHGFSSYKHSILPILLII